MDRLRLAFQVGCSGVQTSLRTSKTPKSRCAFSSRRTIGTACNFKRVSRIRASAKRGARVQDEAFSTCTSCGSDEVVSASRILERKSITVKCSQCGTRFTATAKDALTTTGTPLLDLEKAAKEEEAKKAPNEMEVKLYISGLPPRIDSEGLKKSIEEFGEVTYSKVVIDRVTGRSRGFGFVTVKGRSTAAAVIDILSGDSRRLGTKLRVREAIE